MAAYQNLPWLAQSDQFLNAIIAGGRAGLEREQMAQRERIRQPRGMAMQSEFVPPGGFPVDPRAEMASQRIAAEQQAQGEQRMAWDVYSDLLRRGATEQEAYGQTGLGRFGVKPPGNPFSTVPLGRGGVAIFNESTGDLDVERAPEPFNSWDAMSLGRGGVARVNPATGELQVLREPNPETDSGPNVRVPIYPPGVSPLVARSTGIQPTFVSGSLSEVGPIAGTNLPPQLRTQGVTPNVTPTPTKDAQGGYKVGRVYAGLKYLGGDPNEESNWERTK